MKKWFAMLLSGFCVLSWAGEPATLQNKIVIPLAAQTWVTTDTVNAMITVNATTTASELDALQQKMLQTLLTVDNASWHIVQVNRSESQSGLTNLTWQVQARVKLSDITAVVKKVKAASKSGMQFSLIRTDYTPGFEDQQQAQSLLRDKLYAKAQQAVEQANKTFGNEHYHIGTIDFTHSIKPVPMMHTNFAMEKRVQPLPVSRRVTMNATVMLVNNQNGV